MRQRNDRQSAIAMVNILGFRGNSVENTDNMCSTVAAMVVCKHSAIQDVGTKARVMVRTIARTVVRTVVRINHMLRHSTILQNSIMLMAQRHCWMIVPGKGRPGTESCQQ